MFNSIKDYMCGIYKKAVPCIHKVIEENCHHKNTTLKSVLQDWSNTAGHGNDICCGGWDFTLFHKKM